ncbi:tetratricopeptide repeat protein, partial [Leptolyngbya cf. ectocarpi LEGE 11479]
TIYQRALAIYEAQLGSDHPDTAQSLNDLAELYSVIEQYEKAKLLYVRALEIIEAILGIDHPNRALTSCNLAAIFSQQGDYARAENLYTTSIEVILKALGQEHPSTKSAIGQFLHSIGCAVDAGQEKELSSHPLTRELLAQVKAKQSG